MKDTQRHTSRAARIVRGVVITAILIPVVAVVLLCGVSLYLTPERLTKLVNRSVAGVVDGRVHVSRIDYTLWSSFPQLHVNFDTLDIVSNGLRRVPEATRRRLPADCDSLVQCGDVSGSLNLLSLLRGEVSLSDLRVGNIRVNMVAVNDSVNNFNISRHHGKTSIPFITTNKLTLEHGGDLKLFNLRTATRASLRIDSLTLLRNERDFTDRNYTLGIGGIANARSGSLIVLDRFPIRLDGKVGLKFDPFGIALNDYKIALGNTNGTLNMSMQLGDKMRINDLQYDISRFDIGRLLGYIPVADFPVLSSLDANMSMRASARLTSPYNPIDGELPSMLVQFDMPAGNLGYTANTGRRHDIAHTPVHGELRFDGHTPEASTLAISQFGIVGDGINLRVAADVAGLTGNPVVDAKIEGTADLTTLGNSWAELARYQMAGDAVADLHVRFMISELAGGSIDGMTFSGTAGCTGFYINDIAPDTELEADRIAVAINADARTLGDGYVAGSLLKLAADADNVRVRQGDMLAYAGDIKAATSLHDDGRRDIRRLGARIPLNLDIRAGKAIVFSPHDTLHADVRDLHLTGTAHIHADKMIAESFGGTLEGGKAKLRLGTTRAELQSLHLDFDASKLAHAKPVADYATPARWVEDSVSLGFVNHTPAFLQVAVNEQVRSLLEQWRADVDLKVGGGSFTTPAFPVMTEFGNLDLAASTDSVTLRNIDLGTLSTRARIGAKISNIRQFLCSHTPAPLNVNLDVAIDTVQCNELAAAYERGLLLTKGPAGVKIKPHSEYAEGSDTVTLMIPRNIIAHINAKAMQTHYSNLHLYNLSTGVDIADGKAKVDNLRVYADFGHARLDYLYDSSDIQALGMEVNAGLLDVDIVSFFKNFHQLLVLMPEMSNLTGTISARAHGGLNAFPDMYADMASVNMAVDVKGRKLKLHQTPFIRHITDMMLIRDDGDLDIANFNAHAYVHDNLVDVNPFAISFSDYKVVVAGTNNFAGDMYYHVGIEKSPILIPFGINIKGDFHHPEFRFGGAEWKDIHGTEISANVMENEKINLITQTRYYMRVLVHKAAEDSHLPLTAYSY